MATQLQSDPKTIDGNVDSSSNTTTNSSNESGTINNNIFLDITDNEMPKAYSINL